MSPRSVLGVILIGHAAFVAIQLIINFDDLRQSAINFAAPEDPFGLFSGLLAFNVAIIIVATTLGAYLIWTKKPKLAYVLPLAIVAALYGGYSLAIGGAVLVLCLLKRYRSSEI